MTVDDVKAGTSQPTKNGAVRVVPTLDNTQDVDTTIAPELDDVFESVQQRSDRVLRQPNDRVGAHGGSEEENAAGRADVCDDDCRTRRPGRLLRRCTKCKHG